jgi:S1-C subfamily serine protease
MKLGFCIPTIVISAVVSLPAHANLTTREIAQTAKEVTVKIENTKDATQNGSGFIVSKRGNNYTVLTIARLVTGDRRQYFIHTTDENKHPIIGIELLPMNLALVRFSSVVDYEVAELADGTTDLPKVFISGFPFPTGQTQQEYRFTDGKITMRLPNRDKGYDFLYEAPTSTGMGGSAIFNEQGKVIGIHMESGLQTGVRLDGTARLRIVTNGAIAIKAFLEWQAQKK